MNSLLAELDCSAGTGQRITFWLRDDDAVTTTPALDRLLSQAATFDVPVVLAVIPMPAEPELASSLSGARTRIALHGLHTGSSGEVGHSASARGATRLHAIPSPNAARTLRRRCRVSISGMIGVVL